MKIDLNNREFINTFPQKVQGPKTSGKMGSVGLVGLFLFFSAVVSVWGFSVCGFGDLQERMSIKSSQAAL